MKPWYSHNFLSVLKTLHRVVWPKGIEEVTVPSLDNETTNVVSFQTRKAFVVPNGPENKLISQLLEETLIQSKRGEIQGLLIAYIYDDGAAGGAWTGRPSKLIFAAERQLRRVHSYVDQTMGE